MRGGAREFSSLSLGVPVVRCSADTGRSVYTAPVLRFLRFLRVFEEGLPVFDLRAPTRVDRTVRACRGKSLASTVLALRGRVLNVLRLVLTSVFINECAHRHLRLTVRHANACHRIANGRIGVRVAASVLFCRLVRLIGRFLVCLVRQFPRLLFLLYRVNFLQFLCRRLIAPALLRRI